MQALPPPLGWREVRTEDAALLDALFLAGREDLLQIAADAAVVQQLVQMQQRAQEAGLRQAYPDALHFIIERGGQAVGRVRVHLGARELRLLDITVLPQARRGGVARAVVTHLQREAAARGLPMGLTVAASNAAARSLYLVLGFTVMEDAMVVQHMAWRAGTVA